MSINIDPVLYRTKFIDESTGLMNRVWVRFFQQLATETGASGSITLAKLTSTGTNGSITVTNGVITAFTNPT